jgi:hypothetical protein
MAAAAAAVGTMLAANLDTRLRPGRGCTFVVVLLLLLLLLIPLSLLLLLPISLLLLLLLLPISLLLLLLLLMPLLLLLLCAAASNWNQIVGRLTCTCHACCCLVPCMQELA